jgi:hypothetical protein
MKIRSPKAEARRKAEIRNPTSEGQSVGGTWSSASAATTARMGSARSSFGFQGSAFLRVSGFGFRVWTGTVSVLAARLSFAAATNSLAPDAIPPLRPPQAEMPPTFWEQYGLWIIVLGVLLVALGCAAAWLLTRPKPPVMVPPEVQARQELEPLRQQPEDGALLSRVSQVLHRYVAGAFDLPPGELTTAEFCHAIAGHGPIGPELSAALSEFLRQCDQRKFSPPAPAPPFSAVAQALKLIDQAQTRRLALAQPAAPPTGSPNVAPPRKGIEK